MTYIGLIGSVFVLIWLAMKGVNIIFSAIVCSLLVIVTNGLPLSEGMTDYFSFGPLGAFTFAGKFFLLFAAGAMFGRVMGESHFAASIAMALVRVMGAHRVLWIIAMATAILTYGGVVAFVVIFAVYPLGLKLLKEADLPKRLFCSSLALGAGTFTLTALPGTPSIHNVISSTALGTTLFAGGWLGLMGGALMFGLGMWYLERQRKKAVDNEEHFIPSPTDNTSNLEAVELPSWYFSIIPLALVLLTIMIPRVASSFYSTQMIESSGHFWLGVLAFSNANPIVWPSFALLVGTLSTLLISPVVRQSSMQIIGTGVQDSIMPLINTSAVVGFGGVVTHTDAFAEFTVLMLQSEWPPLFSSFLSVSLVSAVTGSASGGLQIFMQTMAQQYLELGLDPATLHRIATMASGGLDSLPHSGAIVALLTITGMSHRQAYRDVGVVTVVIPLAATLSVIAVAALL